MSIFAKSLNAHIITPKRTNTRTVQLASEVDRVFGFSVPIAHGVDALQLPRQLYNKVRQSLSD